MEVVSGACGGGRYFDFGTFLFVDVHLYGFRNLGEAGGETVLLFFLS